MSAKEVPRRVGILLKAAERAGGVHGLALEGLSTATFGSDAFRAEIWSVHREGDSFRVKFDEVELPGVMLASLVAVGIPFAERPLDIPGHSFVRARPNLIERARDQGLLQPGEVRLAHLEFEAWEPREQPRIP